MTTIAFKDGIVAADTLIRSGMCRVGYVKKIQKHRRVISLGVGPMFIVCAFHKWVAEGMIKDEMPKIDGAGDNRADCATINRHGVVTEYGDGASCVMHGDFFAWGSGMEYALGAMEMGASANDALMIALKFDTGSGGKVDIIRLTEINAD